MAGQAGRARAGHGLRARPGGRLRPPERDGAGRGAPPRHPRRAARRGATPDARAAVLDAAAAFLREALSTFEIAHRGYREMQQVARRGARARDAAARAGRRLGAHQRGGDHGGDAAAHGRRRARRARRRAMPPCRAAPATRSPRVLSADGAAGRGGGADLGAPARRRAPQRGAAALGMLEVRDARTAASPIATRRSSPSSASSPPWRSRSARPTRASATSRQSLQRSLLPRRAARSARPAVAVRFSAAGEGIEVGGDFYDVFLAARRRLVAR